MAEYFPYEDIVNLPRHISKVHPQATMADRAARFSPFAAISGYEDMVKEAARVTEERIDITDATKELLNEKLNMIIEFLDEEPEVTITYFEPDKKKDGGAYVSKSGIVIKVREYERDIVTDDGTKIPIEDIYSISGKMFDDFDV